MTPEGAVSIHHYVLPALRTVHARRPQETRVQMAQCRVRMDITTEANCSGLGRAWMSDLCFIDPLWNVLESK